MHCGYVVKVESLRKHTNADKLQIATFFGNDTSVDLSVKVGDIGVYFPVDLQLSEEYCARNNLVRKKDANGNNIGGFLDPNTRNIKAIKLRGEKSDGLFMPLRSFAYCYDIDIISVENTDVEFLSEKIPLNVGDQVSILNDHEICKKYIPIRKPHGGGGSSTSFKRKIPYSPLFREHADTEQLAYNLSAFKPGDEIEITLKMHGTSGRTGYLPVFTGYKDNIFLRAINKLRMGLKVRKNWGSNGRNALYHSFKHGEPVYDYGYVSGTRRVVFDDYEGGFYGDNQFREQHSKIFEGKLMKGETVYYEIVGFTTYGQPLMGDADNRKTKDKEFIKQYGETTTFSYGCSPEPMPALMYGPTGEVRAEAVPQSDIYVYRMTMTNEDGFVVDYTPDFMRYRCEQLGVKTVPVFYNGFIPPKVSEVPLSENEKPLKFSNYITPGDWVKDKAEEFYNGPDPVGKNHIREGVVVRIINRPKFVAFKHKNFSFKVLSGIVVENADVSSMTDDMLSEL